MACPSAHKASIDIFDEAGMDNLIAKSNQLSAFCHFILEDINNGFPVKQFLVITPGEASRHGCQVSILFNHYGKEVFGMLSQNGIVSDWREPNVIRIAPVPLYNSFEDVYRFGKALKDSIESLLY